MAEHLPVSSMVVYGPASAHWAAVVAYARECGEVSDYGMIDFEWLHAVGIPNTQSLAIHERVSALLG